MLSIKRISCIFDVAGSLCQDDFDKFKSWSFNWTEDDGSLLSESGKLEMFQIGQRTRKRFLDDNLNDTHIKVSFGSDKTQFSDPCVHYTFI